MVTLKNGLRALLISDRDVPLDTFRTPSDTAMDTSQRDDPNDVTDDDDDDDDDDDEQPQTPVLFDSLYAYAALSVNVGSLHEPEDLPGLAHYLEHMLFMGNEKFRKANDWDKFVKETAGGDNNARTDVECTTFHFDVQSNYLKKALERFSEFFVSPLFRQDNMQSEVEIVDKEFNETCMSDANRVEHLLATTAKEGHPMKKFTWGNIQSLKIDPEKKKINVRNRIIEFFNEYYVAHNMALVVQSNETLDTLQCWVTKYFSRIRNSDCVVPDFVNLGPPFDTCEFNRFYKVIPVRNICQLHISWALPSLMPLYRTRPDAYVSYILGHEGEGSLLSALRRRHYAFDITAGVRNPFNCDQEHNKTWTCFNVTISLTDLGFRNIDEVVRKIFECLKMMRDEGPLLEHWDEVNFVEKSEFIYMTPDAGGPGMCFNFALNMWKYRPTDIVTAQYIQQMEFDETHIKFVLDMLTADRVNLIVLSQNYADCIECIQEEKWFKTKYFVQDIPCSWRQSWRNTILDVAGLFDVCSDARRSCELHYPDPNPYIATMFTLNHPPDGMPAKLTEPMLVDECAELWYYMDPGIKVPRAYVNFYLKSIHAISSPECKAMTAMYCQLLNMYLIETCYPAEIARLTCSITALDYGLAIRLYGFNHKMSKYFKVIVAKMKKFTVNIDEFECVKTELDSTYLNLSASPELLNREFCQSALRSDYWTTIDTREALEKITVDDLEHFVEQFYNGMYIEGLVEGNLPFEEAEEMLSNLQDTLRVMCPNEDNLRTTYVTEIPPGNFLYSVKNINPCDEHTSIHNYYQYPGVATLEDKVLNEIFLLFMREPSFYYLRTKYNLCYTPYATGRTLYNVIGFSITILSSARNFSAKKIDDCIESFLVEFNKQVQNLTPAKFEAFMNTMRTSKTFEFTFMKDEVDRHWTELLKHSYEFDNQNEQREVLDVITLDMFKEWSASHSIPCPDRRKLSVQVIGHSNAAQTAKSKSDRCTDFSDDIKFVNDPAMTKKYCVIKDLKDFRTKCRKYCVNLYSGSSNSETKPAE